MKKQKFILTLVFICIIFISNAQVTTWTELGPTYSPGHNSAGCTGQIHSIAFDPNYNGTSNKLMYAGSGYGCLYKSNDSGLNWQSITDNLPIMGVGYTAGAGVADIAVNPLRGKTIYFATGDGQGMPNIYTQFAEFSTPSVGVYKSKDGGNTWSPTGLKFQYDAKIHISRLIINPQDTNILIAAASDGIYRTTNAGNSWTKVYNVTDNFPLRGLEFKPGDPTIVYASGTSILKSIDGGEYFGQMSPNPTITNETAIAYNIAVSPNNPNILYANLISRQNVYPNNVYYHFFYFDGTNWLAKSDCPAQWSGYTESRLSISASPYKYKEVFIGQVKIYRSPEVGNSWGQVLYSPQHDDCHALEYAPGGDSNQYTIFLGTDGGLYKYSFNGTTWSYNELNNGLSVVTMNRIGGTESNPNLILTGQQDDYSFKFDNSASPKWTYFSAGGGDGREKIIDYSNSNIWYSIALKNGVGGIYGNNCRTINSGASFPYFDYPSGDPNINAENDAPVIIDPVDHNLVYFGYCDLWKGTFNEYNNNVTYSQVSYKSDLRSADVNNWWAIEDIAIVPYYTSGNLHRCFYVSNLHCDVFKSTDGGLGNWSKIVSLPSVYSSKISIAANPEDKDWICVGYSSIENMDYDIFYDNRIQKSIDGGVTWEAYGQGLPNIPVNTMVYERGSNNAMYVGTDLGVYYRAETMTNWVLLTGLPSLRIKDMEINYCAQKLRVATYGRGLWEADLIETENTISNSITWSSPRTLSSTQIIPNGVTLTIIADVNIVKNKKIIVQPGGQLIINGAKLTNTCSDMWQGIEVWGESSFSQYEIGGVCYQGKVVLSNGATIENAYLGITNCNPSYQSTQAGGIILATETNFNNNRVAIDFVPYSNVLSGTVHNNLSYFVKCNFTRDRALYNNTAFVSFADLKTVYGIKFYGCNFEDSYATSYNQQGTGIMSLDSYFEVKPYCNCEDNPCPTGCMEKGSFRNFAYAIRAQKANTNNYFVVDNTDFYHNNRSIMDEGVNLASITSSYFEFQPPLSGSTYETGIAIYSGTGYTIEENQFTATATNFTSTGVYFYHGGQEDNYVYKNNFTDNQVGISTYGVCKNSNGSTGLQFLCNTFQGSVNYDINTRYGGTNHGVRNLQGSSSTAAGNIFTSCSGSYKNFYNQAHNMITYYYGNGSALENPLCNWSTYFTRNNNTTNNACASHLSSGGGGNRTMSMSPIDIQTLEQDFITDKNAMLSFQSQYNQLIDGGNTNVLENEIDNSNANNTWQLYTKLLNKSPYLTAKVLYKASNKTNVLPNVLLYNLLKQNPDALNSDNLMEHLANKPVPLYGWMIDSLDICRRFITARTKLEEKISYHAGRKDQAGFKIIKNALIDTTATNHQYIQIWTNNMETFYSDIMSINDNMATANYQAAENTLNSMPLKYNLEEDYALEYQWFADLFGLFKQFHNSNKTIYQLDSNDVQQVKYIADNGFGCGKVYARNICRLYGYVYEPEFIEYDDATAQNKSMIQNNPESQQLINKEDNVECYPNPAKEWIIFKWVTVSAENSLIITIANSLSSVITTIKTDGTIGEKIIDTNEWPVGIYYYKAEKNGQVVKGGKVVITR